MNIRSPEGKNIHELDIHHDSWLQVMDDVMAGKIKLPFVDLSGYTHQATPNIYVPPKPDAITVREVGPREADQAGGGFPAWQKQDMVRAAILARMSAIEVGFAAGVDMPMVEWAIGEFGNQTDTRLSALTQFSPGVINEASRVLEKARNSGIHIFYPTQSDHIRVLARDPYAPMDDIRNDVLAMIEQNVKVASNNLGSVEFSPEVAMDTDPVFLLQAVRTAIINGATIINMPDTRGGASPFYVMKLFRFIYWGTQDLRTQHTFSFSCHNHDDNGMAIANSIAAIHGGASEVESTFLGLGEGAGNAATEIILQSIRQQGFHAGEVNPYLVARIADYTRAAVYDRVIRPFGPGSDADGAGVHKDRWLKYVAYCQSIGKSPDPSFYRAGGAFLNFHKDKANVVIGKLGGTGQFVDALSQHGIILDKKHPKIITLQKIFSGDPEAAVNTDEAQGLTQEVKMVYDSNVYAQYLRNEGILQSEEISLIGGRIYFKFTIDGVTFEIITDEMTENSGAIPVIVHAMNKFLGGNIIEFKGNPDDKPIFTPVVAHEQFPDIHPEDEGGHVEDSTLWADVLISIDGVEKKSRVKGQNTDLTYAKAIFEACLQTLLKKVRDPE